MTKGIGSKAYAASPSGGGAVSATSVAASYVNAVLTDGPLIYWRLDDAVLNSTAADVSGNARHGTYEGSITRRTTGLLTGDDNTAVTFTNAQNERAGISHASWQSPNYFTAEVIFKPTNLSLSGELAGKTNYGTMSAVNYSWFIRVEGSTLRVFVQNTGGTNVERLITSAFTVNQIYHIMLTFDGSNVRTYLNGTQVDVVALTGVLATGSNARMTVGAADISHPSVKSSPGVVDEFAFYGTVLSGTRASAHYGAMIGSAPSTISGGQAVETDSALTGTVPITVVGGQASETDSALAGKVPTYLLGGKATETDTAQSGTVFTYTLVTGGKATETDTALTGTVIAPSVIAGGKATETDSALAGTVDATLRVSGGQASETDSAFHGSVLGAGGGPNLVAHSAEGTASADLEGGSYRQLGLLLPGGDTYPRGPWPILVTLTEGHPDTLVNFYVDGVLVHTDVADSVGYLSVTINVPEDLSTKGMHTITATQDNASDAEAVFYFEKVAWTQDTIKGPDAPPVEIVGALTSNGVYRWVFQDVLPVEDGGIGSYVLPMNPKEMSSPHTKKAVVSKHTASAISGMWHVFEGSPKPHEWTFSGYCPTEEMQLSMQAYFDINRRFYVIDHRNRAWKVVFLDMDWKPRLHQVFNGTPTHWGHDYTVTALILEEDWGDPE